MFSVTIPDQPVKLDEARGGLRRHGRQRQLDPAAMRAGRPRAGVSHSASGSTVKSHAACCLDAGKVLRERLAFPGAPALRNDLASVGLSAGPAGRVCGLPRARSSAG